MRHFLLKSTSALSRGHHVLNHILFIFMFSFQQMFRHLINCHRVLDKWMQEEIEKKVWLNVFKFSSKLFEWCHDIAPKRKIAEVVKKEN